MRTTFLSLTLLSMLTSVGAFAQSSGTPAKGDQKLTYSFPDTGESIPYHLYVPSTWTPAKKLPLVVILHGMGASVDSPFERGEGILGKLAEQRGYIVVAPTGYKLSAGYNNPFALVPATRPAAANGGAPQGGGAAKGGGVPKGGGGGGKAAPITAEDRERSEKDVMLVADMIAKQYNADPKRTFLMGNSMGGGGTWYLGQKYNDKWAAIVPTAGPLADADYPYDRLKNMPVMTVQGDADTTLSYEGTVAMVAHAKAKGINIQFITVPGGDHLNSWAQRATEIFDFLDKQGKK